MRGAPAVALALVGLAGAAKALLFWNLEYRHSDLYSCLDMSRSWLLHGRLLHENAYGSEALIHNFYLLLAFSPLTLALGAYGFVLGLTALHAFAAARLARTRALDAPGRLAALAALLSPFSFYAFDDRLWGFHSELCYPPLAVLFLLALVEGRGRAALVAALALVLVKEDGALVCAAVLAAHHGQKLWEARRAPAEERRRLAGRAAAQLSAAALAFVAGLALLWWLGRSAPEGQATAAERLSRALGIVSRTLADDAGGGRLSGLGSQLAAYSALTALALLPLGSAARLRRAAALVALGAVPVVTVLLVSDAHYKFRNLLWAPRAATLLAVVVGCAVVSASGRARAPSSRRVALFSAASWALQLALLGAIGYPIAHRLDLAALWQGRGYARAALSEREQRLWPCVASGLPIGTPVSALPELLPFFHRQSIVFEGLEERALEAPRLRAFRAAASGAADGRRCVAAGLPAYCVEATPEVERLVLGCAARP